MPRERSPERDKAFELYKEHKGDISNREIANMLGLSEKTVSGWKCKDKWDELINGVLRKTTPINTEYSEKDTEYSEPKKRVGAPLGNHNAKGHGAPKGNKNAIGNRGGNGGPPGNKNALTTGEHESIWFDCLTEEEQGLYQVINTDTLAQVESDIRLITLRERRMMERIRRFMNGLTEKERKVLQEMQVQKNPVQYYDERTGESKTIIMPEAKLVVTEITETEPRTIDDIVRLEEALTRVQEKKAKLLDLKHRIETAKKGEGGSNGGSTGVQFVDDIGSDDDAD